MAPVIGTEEMATGVFIMFTFQVFDLNVWRWARRRPMSEESILIEDCVRWSEECQLDQDVLDWLIINNVDDTLLSSAALCRHTCQVQAVRVCLVTTSEGVDVVSSRLSPHAWVSLSSLPTHTHTSTKTHRRLQSLRVRKSSSSSTRTLPFPSPLPCYAETFDSYSSPKLYHSSIASSHHHHHQHTLHASVWSTKRGKVW